MGRHRGRLEPGLVGLPRVPSQAESPVSTEEAAIRDAGLGVGAPLPLSGTPLRVLTARAPAAQCNTRHSSHCPPARARLPLRLPGRG